MCYELVTLFDFPFFKRREFHNDERKLFNSLVTAFAFTLFLASTPTSSSHLFNASLWGWQWRRIATAVAASKAASFLGWSHHSDLSSSASSWWTTTSGEIPPNTAIIPITERSASSSILWRLSSFPCIHSRTSLSWSVSSTNSILTLGHEIA